MSRVDELIAELCPDGVKFATIGECAEVTAGATPSKAVAEYWTNGTIPWLSSGEVNKRTIFEADTLISQAGYDSCSTRMIPSGAVVMALAGQGKTRGMVARTRLACCTNQSLASIVPSQDLDSDFLYYYLSTQYARLRDVSSGDGTRGGLNLVMIRAFRVPVPPLEVQREIVRILDTFSQLEAELEAELEARQRQYEHYKKLLLFTSTDETWITVADCCRVFGGAPFRSELFNDRSDGMPVVRIRDINTGFSGTYYSGPYDPRYRVHDGDILIGMDGEFKTVRWAHGDAVLNQRVSRLQDFNEAFDSSYVFYIVREAIRRIQQTTQASTVKHLSTKQIASIRIPHLSLSDQRARSAALDKFDAIVNDPVAGLPGELVARRKQYEYYRDKLLHFAEVAA